MAGYRDGWWQSADGLRLHYRDYAAAGGGNGARPTLLCLPGLTRNARDYEGVAPRLADAGWRVLAVSFRGRGESAPARDAATYVPGTYADDLALLLDELGVARAVLVGTSLGGLVAMLLAERRPGLVAGAALNDVGPELEPRGLQRIRGYVGRASSWPTWMHAARAVREAQEHAYPDYDLTDWLAMTKRLYRLSGSGRVVLDYDLRIAEPLRAAATSGLPATDWWAALRALGDAPVLILRGERSDVLGAAAATRAAAALSGAELVTVPGVGHAPTLGEPAAAAALDRLLSRVEGAA